MNDKDISPLLDLIRVQLSYRRPVVVAVDGRSGTGKSTIAETIAACIDAVSVDQDDFYAGGDFDDWIASSPVVRADQCIDWRRVREELLLPLISLNRASYVPFDWDEMRLSLESVREVNPADVIVLDGTYSTRRELSDLIDVTVLVTLDDSIRHERLRERERDDWSADWFALWDEAEDTYFRGSRTPEAFDIIIDRTPRESVERT